METKRRAPTKKEVIAVLLRQECKCADCRARLQQGAFDWDHITPLALGGENSAENFQALCQTCHAKKTNGTPATTYGSDKHAIAKCKRLADPKKPKGTIQSRGFDKSLKKKFDGTVQRK